MQRRGFLIRLTQARAALGTLPTALRANPRSSHSAPLHPQNGRIAGSQHCACRVLLPRLRVSNPLTLCRQPDNPHDERAIEVFWRDARRIAARPHPCAARAGSLARMILKKNGSRCS